MYYAVSYAHLDVYKRQDVNNDGQLDSKDMIFMGYVRPDKVGGIINTLKDVYKRQVYKFHQCTFYHSRLVSGAGNELFQ